MRTLWLLALLLVTLHACSDDGDGGDGDGGAAGNGGSANTAGGSGGGSLAGSGGSSMAGTGGGTAAGSGGSSMAGTGGSSSAMGGSAGMGGSGATGCAAFCERSLPECTNDDIGECLSSCENSAELCPEESAAVNACVLPRPDSDFHCETGITTINDGLCDAEAAALGRCLFF